LRLIKYYQTKTGKEPCRDWLNQLDMKAQYKIDAYIKRAALRAAKKNIRSLGDGIFEIKIDYGPGYRVYFAEVGNTLILLLIGGDKSSQFRDIRQAKDYWRDYASK
jgi:putative addiction module killer protein